MIKKNLIYIVIIGAGLVAAASAALEKRVELPASQITPVNQQVQE